MTSALDRALADADRSRFAAKAAVSASGAARALTAPATGMPYSSPDLGRHAEQYLHFNGWQYVAIGAIARRVAGQAVCVARAPSKPTRRKSFKSYTDTLTPLESHPLLDAIDDPNEIMVRWSLLYTTVASMKLTGKSYWWMPQSDRGRREIWPIPAHWIKPADKLRSSWWLRPFGGAVEFPVPAGEVGYFNLPDPADPFGTVSPLSTQARAVNADEAIQTAQDRAFRNGLHPGLAVRVGDVTDLDNTKRQPALSKEQRDQIINTVKQMYAGVLKHGEPVILDALIKDVFPITNKITEMDFLQSGDQTKSRILQAYGVNPLIVGQIEGANRAQAVVAEESFCNNVVNPLLELMSQVMTAWVGPAFAPSEKLVVWIDPCRAHDPEQTLREWQAGLSAGAVTVNEYRARILGLPPIPGGDEMMTPMTMVPRAPAKAARLKRHALNGRH